MSDGSLVSLCASSSLYDIRCAMSTSAIVLFHKDVLSYLVSVDVCAIQLKSEDELFQSGLDFCSWLHGRVLDRCQYAQRVRRSRVHSARGSWASTSAEPVLSVCGRW